MIKSPFRTDALQGKVVLITGGGTGINYEIATVMGKHGASVAIMGRRKDVLEKAAEVLQQQKIKALPIQGDVRSAESCVKIVQEVVKHFGRLDILINGAAGNFLCPAEDLSPNGFKTVLEIDLLGTFQMSHAAFSELKKNKGSIINISATLHYHTTPWQVHASAAKAGVDSVTQSLAHEWGDYGIRVNGIAPGPIKDTEGMSKLGLGPPPEELEALVSEAVPLHRLGNKEDIAYAAVFLASDAASYLTGDIIVVDGGASLWGPKAISREALQALQNQRQKKTQSKL